MRFVQNRRDNSIVDESIVLCHAVSAILIYRSGLILISTKTSLAVPDPRGKLSRHPPDQLAVVGSGKGGLNEGSPYSGTLLHATPLDKRDGLTLSLPASADFPSSW